MSSVHIAYILVGVCIIGFGLAFMAAAAALAVALYQSRHGHVRGEPARLGTVTGVSRNILGLFCRYEVQYSIKGRKYMATSGLCLKKHVPRTGSMHMYNIETHDGEFVRRRNGGRPLQIAYPVMMSECVAGGRDA